MPKTKNPEGIWNDKQIDDFLKSRGADPAGSVATGAPGKVPPAVNPVNQFIEDYPFTAGVGQGVAGYAEAPAYYAEKGIQQFRPDFKMPLHERAADIRNRVESTGMGQAGEFVGTMLPAFIPNPLSEMAVAARGGMGAAELGRLSSVAQRLGPGTTGVLRGGAGGLLSRPAQTPQEAWDQATMGGLFGGVGGAAAGRIGERAAARAGREGVKAWSRGEEMGQAAEREAAAKGAMRYTGTGTFEPAPQAEARTPRDILREHMRRDRAEKAEEREGGKAGRFTRIGARGAGFALGHLTAPHPFQRVMGHVYSQAFEEALNRMNRGEVEGLRDYIDTFLSRRGGRKTFASRGGAFSGAAGPAVTENDPTQGMVPPVTSVIPGMQ